MGTWNKINDSALQSIEQDTNEQGVQLTCTRLIRILNLKKEKYVVQVITHNELVWNVACFSGPTKFDTVNEKAEDLEKAYRMEKNLISL